MLVLLQISRTVVPHPEMRFNLILDVLIMTSTTNIFLKPISVMMDLPVSHRLTGLRFFHQFQ
jgi:hypothetical protein